MKTEKKNRYKENYRALRKTFFTRRIMDYELTCMITIYYANWGQAFGVRPRLSRNCYVNYCRKEGKKRIKFNCLNST